MRLPWGIHRVARRPPWVLGATGLALCAATVGYAHAFFPAPVGRFWISPTTETVLVLLEVVVMLFFSLSVVYAGSRLRAAGYSTEQQWWVVLWSLMGLSGVLALVVLVQINQTVDGRPLPRQTVAEELLLGAGSGAVAGLFTGLTNARLRSQDDRMALQHDAFKFMNQFLRHYVLNGMQAMQGYANMIPTADDEERREYATRISERAEHITEVVSNLQRLSVSMSGSVDLQAVNVSKILTEEIRDVRAEYPDATLDTRLDSHVYVRADCFLRTICRILIVHAVEHADDRDPQVEVTMEVTPDSVYLNVADNGPDVPVATPTHDLDRLEPQGAGTDGRVDLYIADRIIQTYGGRVAVLENQPQGMIVRSQLHRPS